MDFAVIQTVRVGRTARHIVRLLVREAPERTKNETVAEAITEAGIAPAESGIEWANHRVTALNRLPKGSETPEAAPVWTWGQLQRPALRQLNVRISRRLYARCEAQAAAAGLPLTGWVQDVLTGAVSASESVSSV